MEKDCSDHCTTVQKVLVPSICEGFFLGFPLSLRVFLGLLDGLLLVCGFVADSREMMPNDDTWNAGRLVGGARLVSLLWAWAGSIAGLLVGGVMLIS